LQRHAANQAEPATVPPIVHEVLQSPGQPLDAATRAFFEPRFGHDFSRVKIHADSEAAASAVTVNALAYTVGDDVVFGPGRYGPATDSGQRLLAHELAHVVQQGRGTGAPAPLGDSELERSAEQAATDFIEGHRSVRVAGSSGPGLARVFAPRSLERGLDPSSMSEDEISREIELITRWLNDNPTSPDLGRLATALAKLKEELGHRPTPRGKIAAAGAVPSPGRSNSAEFRFPLPLVKEPAPPAPVKEASSESFSINTPPPPAPKGSSIESLLPVPPTPTGPSPLERDLLGPGLPPAASTGTTEPKPSGPSTAPPAPMPGPKSEGQKPGLGLQTGTGEQTGLRLPTRAFQYVQVSAEWSNKYALSLDEKTLPPFLSNVLKSISFVGEPGLTVQYHVLGDQPKTFDLQFLFKLMQLSLRKVDVSLVGGGQFTDLARKWEGSRVTPLVGIESETEIAKKGPVSLTWVFDALGALPTAEQAPGSAGPGQSPPGRQLDGQLSGELRLKIELP
jgi:hypothetical protein